MITESQLRELELASNRAPYAGGTLASRELRACLKAFKESANDSEAVRDRLWRLIDVWRVALKRHNAQPLKFVEYNLETGEPNE